MTGLTRVTPIMTKLKFSLCMAAVFLLSACTTSQTKPGTVFDSITG